MAAWIHRLRVIVYERLFSGRSRRDIEVESGVAKKRIRGTSRWPAEVLDGWSFADVDICNDIEYSGQALRWWSYVQVRAAAAWSACALSSQSVVMLGLSCGENTARNGGINFDTFFNVSAISLAWARWNSRGKLPPGSGSAHVTNVTSESSVLARVYESLYDSCSACTLCRSTGFIPQNGSRSLYIRSYSSGNWTSCCLQ